MKSKLSLNRLLHNNRFILVLSFILAFAVWALVSFGPSNVTTKEFTAQLKVDLANTVAGYNDLRVIGNDTFSVKVRVEGPRSVVFNLDSDDVTIRPDVSSVHGPGEAVLQLNVAKSGVTGDYDIVDIYPREVTVNCDYWTAAEFAVTADVSSIKVQDEKNQLIGNVILDAAVLPNGTARVEGPRAVIEKIAAVTAKVEAAETINSTKRYSAQLKATDEEGNEVDLTDCVFTNTADGTVDLTVPVWVQKKVNLTYQVLNAPAALAGKPLSLSTETITLVGEEAELERVAATVADLGVFNFDFILPEEAQKVITLNVPSNVRVLEGNTVTATFNIEGYTTKKLSFQVDGLSDVTVENLPAGKTLTLQSQKLSDIVLCGPAASLTRVTANDLSIVLDAGNDVGTGSVRYAVRINVSDRNDVWVYYGADQLGYTLYGTLE